MPCGTFDCKKSMCAEGQNYICRLVPMLLGCLTVSSWRMNCEHVYLNQVMLETGRFSMFFLLVWQLQNQMLWFSW